MLGVDRKKLLRLSELHVRVLIDPWQYDVRKAIPVPGNILAASVARPENLEYRRLERLDVLVDEGSILRSSRFFSSTTESCRSRSTGSLNVPRSLHRWARSVIIAPFLVLWL